MHQMSEVMKKGSIKKLYWEDIRDNVLQINPKLGKVIDEINPGKEFALYKAEYPFGSMIVKKGLFYVPSDSGKILPIDNPHIDSEIKQDFEYSENGLPAGIVLDNAYELFINAHDYTLPILTATPGQIFALWKQLDAQPSYHPVKMFNVTSGARSIFMLPNVGDVAFHKNLKRDFNVRKAAPKMLLDQWEIFKTIYEHTQSDWSVSLLFFTGKWLEKMKSDPAWQQLYLLLLECGWKTSAYERNRLFYDFAFSCVKANRNLKLNPYLSDTVQHLLMIAFGAAPGFSVATDNSMGPIKLFQNAYVESYGLKKYAPTIMHPVHYEMNSEKQQPIYYSLQLPSTLSFSPKSRQITNTLQDLSELKYIMDIYLEEILNEELQVSDTALAQVANKVSFDYFHSKPDKHGEIRLSNDLAEKDTTWTSALYEGSSNNFASNGTFVRGCVKIDKQQE